MSGPRSSFPKDRSGNLPAARVPGRPGGGEHALPALRTDYPPELPAARGRHRPLTPAKRASGFALLLAAHGERRPGAENEGVAQLAQRLAEHAAAEAVGVGFLKGSPSIAEAVLQLSNYDLLVYPLFLADGYFTRTLLPRQLEEAGAFGRGRATCLLPPLGLDPALTDLILDRACSVADARGWLVYRTNLVLLAHGSSNNPASRLATQRLGEALAARHRFSRVHAAFLEEPPSLAAVVEPLTEPVVVVGLFAGEGMHGGRDVPAMVAELGRDDVVFVGNIGTFEGLPDMIIDIIRRRWNG